MQRDPAPPAPGGPSRDPAPPAGGTGAGPRSMILVSRSLADAWASSCIARNDAELRFLDDVRGALAT